eukprot:700406-Lingulodinium_polyedra.AAC.1
MPNRLRTSENYCAAGARRTTITRVAREEHMIKEGYCGVDGPDTSSLYRPWRALAIGAGDRAEWGCGGDARRQSVPREEE